MTASAYAIKLFIAVFIPVTGIVQAPPEPKPAPQVVKPSLHPPSEPGITNMFILKNASCLEVQGALRTLLADRPVRLFADERTNSIVAYGAAADFEVVSNIIQQLDVPATGKDANASKVLVVVRLKHRDANSIAQRISEIASPFDRNSRIAADPNAQSVILTGTESFLQVAKNVIADLDAPPRSGPKSVQLEFSFLHADRNAQKTSNLPEHLADVGKELAKLGGLDLVGVTSTVAVLGQKFEVRGNIDAANQTEVRVVGKLVESGQDGVVTIEIDAEMMMGRPAAAQVPDTPPGPRGPSVTQRSHNTLRFELKTTILTRPGETLVIGTAPTGWTAGESGIVVVNVKP